MATCKEIQQPIVYNLDSNKPYHVYYRYKKAPDHAVFADLGTNNMAGAVRFELTARGFGGGNINPFPRCPQSLNPLLLPDSRKLRSFVVKAVARFYNSFTTVINILSNLIISVYI